MSIEIIVMAWASQEQVRERVRFCFCWECPTFIWLFSFVPSSVQFEISHYKVSLQVATHWLTYTPIWNWSACREEALLASRPVLFYVQVLLFLLGEVPAIPRLGSEPPMSPRSNISIVKLIFNRTVNERTIQANISALFARMEAFFNLETRVNFMFHVDGGNSSLALGVF